MNATAGILYGLLYWKKGIETAMNAHYTSDIWVHSIFIVVFGFSMS